MHAEMQTTSRNNRIVSAFIMILNVALVVIYGCGYHIEKLFITIGKPILRLFTINWFMVISELGEWVIATGIRLGQLFVQLLGIIARSFLHDFSWWAPSIGLIAIVGAIVVMNVFSVALEVKINGNVVGYVTDEAEYHAVLNRVETDIQDQMDRNSKADAAVVVPSDSSDQKQSVTVNATQSEDGNADTVASLNLSGQSYAMTTSATYKLSLIRKVELTKEEELYNDVYNAVSEMVGTNFGLYVDGELKAVSSDRAVFDTVLEEVKNRYTAEIEGGRTEFVEDIVIKKGMFASADVKNIEQVRELFTVDPVKAENMLYVCQEGDYMSTIAKKHNMSTAQLKALNPDVKETAIYEGLKLTVATPEVHLQVKTVATETYTNDIAFDVKRESTDKLYKGTTKVKTQGVKGKKRITAEVTYIDGQRISRTVIKTEVIKEPVDKVILVGTKKRQSAANNGYTGNGQQGNGIASGSFRNPLPGSYVSCGWYGYAGHRAVDLCIRGGTLGASVLAADGGKVIFSGWAGGYGNFIKIQHSNGYITCYAHLSSRNVKVGDKVSKGQLIGRAGSTGNSTGPHLHFEIWRNGVAYNPMNFISL